jgi:enoyl-CoA hydratase/carnithine racemase
VGVSLDEDRDTLAQFVKAKEIPWPILYAGKDEGFADRARAVADQLADGPPLVFAAIKEVTRETAHLPVQQAFDMVTKRKLKTVDVLYSSEDQLEGARAFAEKRKPQWKGK